MIRVARQIASVWTDVPGLRRVVEAGLLHHSLAVEGPALRELRGAREEANEARIRDGSRQLQVVAGIGLVDRRVADRRAVVLAHHLRRAGRRDDVRSDRRRVELGRMVVGGERDEMPDEGRRLDDVQVVLVRRGGEVVIDDECARLRPSRPGTPRAPPPKVAGVVVLDRVGHLLGRRARLDLVAERVARRLLGDEQLLTDGEDLVSVGLQLPQANHLLEALGSGLPVGRPPAGGRRRGATSHAPRAPPSSRRTAASRRRVLVADSLRAGRGDDRVEEGRQLLGRLDVDLDPQANRIRHPLAGLGQVRRRLLEPRDHALDPIREWREVAREQGEQRLADVLGRAARSRPMACTRSTSRGRAEPGGWRGRGRARAPGSARRGRWRRARRSCGGRTRPPRRWRRARPTRDRRRGRASRGRWRPRG